MEPFYGRWPWPRSVHGEAVEYMKSDGAAAIGFDIIFAERSVRQEMASETINKLKALAKNADVPEIRDNLFQLLDALKPEASDMLFVSAVEKAGNVFQASVFFVDENDPKELRADESAVQKNRDALSVSAVPAFSKTGRNIFFNATVPFHELAKVSRGAGHINFHPDKDGTCRRSFPLLWFKDPGAAYPSLALIISAHIKKVPLDSITIEDEALISGDAAIPLLPDGSILINYQGGKIKKDHAGKEYYESFYRYIPYDQVIASKDLIHSGEEPVLPKETFRDKIVLVTASAAGLSDLRSTPFSPVTPGVEIHANVIDNILSGKFLRTIDGNLEKLYVFFLALIVGITAALSRPYMGFAAAVALTGSLIGLHWKLFEYGWVLPVVNASVAMAGTYLGVLLIKYVSESREKKRIRSAFGHYLAPQVLEAVLTSPDNLKLGGERRYMTVMFADIENFTSLSEQLAPEKISAVLNEYLGRMLKRIKATGGTLDKFIGDAIMAEWNAPVAQTDHAARACEAALLMTEELRILREEWERAKKPRLNARIGINSGEMVVGNMGSGDIFDYTVIGSEVNISARLEPLNKDFGTNIIISENTKDEAERHCPGKFVFRLLAKAALKGSRVPLTVYELVGFVDTIEKKRLEAIKIYNSGIDNFLRSRFPEAKQFFQQAIEKYPQDGPSNAYISLCEYYENNPPSPGWNGVYIQTAK
ncbi:MAG: adenylate/guanylate cyclase domain-containing protein [Nitrospirae bacterium]|nr:adenylate/guanylate cyclase domain-containing protein [Nitrospirota bacterium]